MGEPLDWMSYLTDKEKLYLERDYDNAVDASEDVRKFACTVAALRALVAEQKRAMEVIKLHFVPHGGCDSPGHASPDICWWLGILALTEADMLERMEVK